MKADGAQLRALQIAFHEFLLGRDRGFAQHVAGAQISVAQRLRIYLHAYRARLLELMRDTFEKTWAYLGDDRFDAAARAYVHEHPPYHRSLRWYGANFAAWLERAFPRDPDIGELAMIDWQLSRAFDGADAMPVPPRALARLSVDDWQVMGVRFAPTLFVAPLRHNTLPIWHALDRGQPPPAVEPLADATWLIIWRKGWEPHFRTIKAIEHAVLSALLAGLPVAEACLTAAQAFPSDAVPDRCASYLHEWLADELIVEITLIEPFPRGASAAPTPTKEIG